MSKIFNYTPSIDLEKHIFWQYNNAPNLNSLVNQKNEWYVENQIKFWNDWVSDVLNIATANDYGLAVWGNLLKIPRTYNVNGNNEALSTEQYRTVILARLRLLKTHGTIPEINELLQFIFGKYGKAYVEDGYDMTMTYHFNFNLTSLQIEVLRSTNLLPRPAGVKISVIAVSKEVFGFNGSGCQPFNQAPFAVYSSVI